MIRIPVLPIGSTAPFPNVEAALKEPDGLLAAGADLSPARLLDAYRHGIFPWYSPGQPILWWSPDPRTVFDTRRMHMPRRLRRWLKHCDWTVRADCAFDEVITACAAPRARAQGTWISPEMIDAYRTLHQRGFAHSIEIFDGSVLVGGIYGVALGCMFFGESMFSRATNASKVALLALCRLLHDWDFPLLDAQIASEHLFSLGAFEIPRPEFTQRIEPLVAAPCVEQLWDLHVPRQLARELLALRND